MSNSSLINQVEDQMVLLNHCYPDVYTQIQGQATQEKAKPRRRKSKGESSNTGFKKRKLSDEQVNMLEFHFQTDHKLDSQRKDTVASQLELHPRQVAVWFQNRRARLKSKKLEEEYLRLKTQHECTVSEKCLLKSQVLKLKEQLSEKEKEKQKLLEKSSRASSNIPSSSISAGVTEPPFLGEFGMAGLESMFCLTENNYEAHGIDYWPNLYDM